MTQQPGERRANGEERAGEGNVAEGNAAAPREGDPAEHARHRGTVPAQHDAGADEPRGGRHTPGAGGRKDPAGMTGEAHAEPYHPPADYGVPPPEWVTAVRPDEPPAPLRSATAWAALATGLLAAVLLGEGLGVNLLLIAVPGALAAHFAARAAGRRPRPWTLSWAAACLALLAVPALRDASWPSTLAVVGALAVGSLGLQGGRTWHGVLLGSFALPAAVPPGVSWAWRGVRERAHASQRRWGPIVRTGLVAAGLLIVFGALFAGADAAFADILGSLVPDASVGDGPLRLLYLLLGVAGALAAARAAAAPWRWDRIRTTPGRARGRVEWALPLVVLNVLFAAFNAVQLTVLFGGYDAVLRETGLTYSEYARQGFWQLLWATVLTLVVIGFALRWAPRGRHNDRTLVRAVLGTLCLLTLVVVLSALRRMDLYVDAYGLTRLRISVAAVELWLGVVIVLLMIAGARGTIGRRGVSPLPRAVAAAAVAGVLGFGLISPDGQVAERNTDRYARTGKIDLLYLQQLSADAVPALDRLPEPLRSCALRELAHDLAADGDEPWYASSYSERRARRILDEHPARTGGDPCARADVYDEDYREAG